MPTTTRNDVTEIHDWREVPAFANEEEEHAFWATHSLGDELLDRMEQGAGDPNLPAPRPRGRAQPISVRLDADLLARLKALARQRNVGYQTLLKTFLEERIAEEERRGAGAQQQPNIGVSARRIVYTGAIVAPTIPPLFTEQLTAAIEQMSRASRAALDLLAATGAPAVDIDNLAKSVQQVLDRDQQVEAR